MAGCSDFMSHFISVSDESKKLTNKNISKILCFTIDIFDSSVEDAVKMWRFIDIRKCFNKGRAV